MSIPEGKIVLIEPMLALAVSKLPEGAAWAYELKFDGYRALGLDRGPSATNMDPRLDRNGLATTFGTEQLA
jgi:hypothetical protein